MLNIVMNIDLGGGAEYRTEYRPAEPNEELLIRTFNKADYRLGDPNIELYIRLSNIVLNIDMEGWI